MFRTALGADSLRERLRQNSRILSDLLKPYGGSSTGHIQPLIVGLPKRAVTLSRDLADAGYKVLPIRVPTVPPGTDRLRFSLSAGLLPETFTGLSYALAAWYDNCMKNCDL